MMQYWIKLSTKHPSETNNYFENSYLESIIFWTFFMIMILQINDLVPTYFFIKRYYAINTCTTFAFTFGKC